MQEHKLLVLREMADAEGDPMVKMMLAAAVQAKELAETKALAQDTARQLNEVSAELGRHLYVQDSYMTVLAFCKRIGDRKTDRESLQKHGMNLYRLAKMERFPAASVKIRDPLYGEVNAWHVDLLNLYFNADVPSALGTNSVR